MALRKTRKNVNILLDKLNEMQKQYDVTWDFYRKSMIFIGKKYNVDAVFALTKAEDIWRGMEKCYMVMVISYISLNMETCLV